MFLPLLPWVSLCLWSMIVAFSGHYKQLFDAASGDFPRLLITLANSLDPDQDRRSVGPNWIQTVRHSEIVLEIFF